MEPEDLTVIGHTGDLLADIYARNLTHIYILPQCSTTAARVEVRNLGRNTQPHHAGSAADLTIQPLDHIVGADACPVLAGEVAVGQRLLNAVLDLLCSFVHLHNSFGYSLLSPFRMECRNFILSESANYASFSVSFLRNLLYIIRKRRRWAIRPPLCLI